jgi:hypothetical protein
VLHLVGQEFPYGEQASQCISVMQHLQIHLPFSAICIEFHPVDVTER